MSLAKKTSVKTIGIVIAVISFFFVITGQVFWSAIHGDGAVYAWIIRKVTENGLFSPNPPYWTQWQMFAEHPYLFFFYSTFFTKLVGFSDLGVKLPNFLIGALSLWLVYRVCLSRDQRQERSYQIGLTACYALILNTIYVLQISQPTLDPLAQLLAVLAILFFIKTNKALISGLVLGLAFVTKGLEMLPHLAAFFILVSYKEGANLKSYRKILLFGLLGVLIPICAWLAYDLWFWQGEWLYTYWSRQMADRVTALQSPKTAFDISYLITFVRIYLAEILILFFGFIKFKKNSYKSDYLFIYFLSYVFFNILAFVLIRKDSSQHMTGVLLLGSVFVGEFIWQWMDAYAKILKKIIPVILFLIATVYWLWFMTHQNRDIWSEIKLSSQQEEAADTNLPIVIQNISNNDYGLFYTTQWYFPNHKTYLLEDADRILIGQDVILIGESKSGKLTKEKVNYKKSPM